MMMGGGARNALATRAAAAAAVALALLALPAQAQVKVENAWVRGAVPGQLSTGAFLDVTSTSDALCSRV